MSIRYLLAVDIKIFDKQMLASVYFRTVEIDIKHQRKIFATLFRGGMASSASFWLHYQPHQVSYAPIHHYTHIRIAALFDLAGGDNDLKAAVRHAARYVRL